MKSISLFQYVTHRRIIIIIRVNIDHYYHQEPVILKQHSHKTNKHVQRWHLLPDS